MRTFTRKGSAPLHSPRPPIHDRMPCCSLPPQATSRVEPARPRRCRDGVASGGGWVIWATISWPRWRSNPARGQSSAPQQTAECDLNVIWAPPGDDETRSFDRVSRSECGCGGRIRTADLRVMSPTSCRCSTPLGKSSDRGGPSQTTERDTEPRRRRLAAGSGDRRLEAAAGAAGRGAAFCPSANPRSTGRRSSLRHASSGHVLAAGSGHSRSFGRPETLNGRRIASEIALSLAGCYPG
jgi:hypothetical protein